MSLRDCDKGGMAAIEIAIDTLCEHDWKGHELKEALGLIHAQIARTAAEGLAREGEKRSAASSGGLQPRDSGVDPEEHF